MIDEESLPQPDITLGGARIYTGWLNKALQLELVEQVREVVVAAPLFSPQMRGGRKMSVRMTSAGAFGWYGDARGYRYIDRHPSGRPWPPIPPLALDLWDALAGSVQKPECCLVNFYGADARMGMHQDKDEADFSQPILSISLGDDALFRVGGAARGGKSVSHWLGSGDVVILGGKARLAYHGIDRIRFGSSSLLARGGRLNLTLRVVS